MCLCVVFVGECCLARAFVVIHFFVILWDVSDWSYCFVDQWGVFVRGMYLYGVILFLVLLSIFLFGGMLCSAVMCFRLWGLFSCCMFFVMFHWLYCLFGCMFDVFFVVMFCCW